MNYINSEFLTNQINRLRGHIRICDFVEMGNTFLSIHNEFRTNNYYENKFSSTWREFAQIFEILGNFSIMFAKKIESEYLGDAERENIRKNIEHMSLHCQELIDSITKNYSQVQNSNNEVEALLEEIHQILEIFSGDLNTIAMISENRFEYILMAIYFRFPIKSFYYELRDNLNTEEYKDEFEKLLFSIIKYSPQEFYLDIRNEIPKWLQFHFMDILNDLDDLPKNIGVQLLDGMSLRMYDYTDFLNYLVTLDIDYEYFKNYSSLYESGDEGDIILNTNLMNNMEIIVLRSLNKRFKEYEERGLDPNKLFEYVQKVLGEIPQLDKSDPIVKSIVKVR
jgi:hypothetical protein